jgi:hypothetical protein
LVAGVGAREHGGLGHHGLQRLVVERIDGVAGEHLGAIGKVKLARWPRRWRRGRR